MTRRTRLAQWGVIRVAGPDARTFLQGQLTSDLRRVSPTRGTLAAWCNPQGRALFLGLLGMQGEDFVWLLPSTEIERCVKRLRMYVLRAKVTVDDLREGWQAAGALDSTALEAFSCSAPAGLPELVLPTDGLVMTWGPTDEVEAWLLNGDSRPATEDDWNLAALLAGLPRVDGPTAERFIPQQLNLDRLGVMSFEKGCYAGQEVIARLKYRGQVRQRLRVGRSRHPLAPGQRLYREGAQASQSAGEVLQVMASDALWHCTAIIDADCDAPLFVGAPDGPRVDFAPPPHDGG